jgi:hypothetical protein
VFFWASAPSMAAARSRARSRVCHRIVGASAGGYGDGPKVERQFN